MSIHKSKGLEFPVVFLCGLSRSFNTSDITNQVLSHKDLGLGLTCTNAHQRVHFPTIAKRAIAAKIRAESVSEELRVLYVAMTRARDRLIMTYAAPKLDEKLGNIALRLDMSDRELLTANVSCPGAWVLICALQRTEAGEFFHISAKPDCSSVQDIPWKIRVIEGKSTAIASSEGRTADDADFPDEIVKRMQSGLRFRYPHAHSVSVPSKLTVTQLKGRFKDQEAAEFAGQLQPDFSAFRVPERKRSLSGTDYGNAMHGVMQYLDLSCCDNECEIASDISRMVDVGLITAQQAESVDTGKIFRFFQTELGQKILGSKEILREFKFSILDDASKYYEGVLDDQILLQGVIDCALIEECSITVLDFKTDYISDTNLSEKIAQYQLQVSTYANALERIYNKPVTAAYIYFFSCEELVRIH